MKTYNLPEVVKNAMDERNLKKGQKVVFHSLGTTFYGVLKYCFMSKYHKEAITAAVEVNGQRVYVHISAVHPADN